MLTAQGVWDGGAGDLLWSSPTNWDDDSVPGAGADVSFAITTGASNAPTEVDFDGNRDIGTLTLTAAQNAYYQIGDLTAGETITVDAVNYTGTVGSPGRVEIRATTWDIDAPLTFSGDGTREFYVESNLTGSNAITMNGTYSLRLGGDNSNFTGGWFLESGNLNISFRAATQQAKDNTFGDSSQSVVEFTGGAGINLNASADVTIANDFVNNADNGSPGFRFSGGTQSDGVLSLTGDFSTGANLSTNSRMSFSAKVGFGDVNWQEGRYDLSGDWSNYTPASGGSAVIAVDTGTLQFNAQQSIAPSSVTYSFNGSSGSVIDPTKNSRVEAGITRFTEKIIMNGAYTMANNVNFSNANATAWANESMQSVGAIHSTGTAEISGNVNHNTAKGGGDVDVNLFSQESGAKLLVSGNVGGSATGGILSINDRYTYGWGESGKPGDASIQMSWRNPEGIVEFTGNNTYASETVVQAGTFLVNNTTGSATGSGNVTVNAGATLGGAGTIGDGSNVDVTINGSLSAGNSPGTMTMDLGTGTLDISSAEDLVFELGTSSDLIALISGTLDIGTDTIGFSDFTFSDAGGLAAGVYTLIDTTETIVGSLDGTDLSGSIDSFTATLGLANGGTDLVLTVVPEPSAYALIAGCLALSWTMIRRRQ